MEWISLKDRLPTAEDADFGGYVIVSNRNRIPDFCKWNEVICGSPLGGKYEYWIKLPNIPE